MRVDKLSMMVDLSRKIRIFLFRRFEHHLFRSSMRSYVFHKPLYAHLRSIGKLMSREIDLAKGSFANETADGVVSDCL